MCKPTIERLTRWFEARSAGPARDEAERRRVAAAALLVECARVDTRYSDEERRTIAAAVSRLFGLDAEVAEALRAVAERRVEEVWHDWLFTDAIKRGFGAQARAALVRGLCDVAFADGELSRREARLIARTARELDVPDEILDEYLRRDG